MWGVSWYPSKSLAISYAAQTLLTTFTTITTLLSAPRSVVLHRSDLPCCCHITAVSVPRQHITTIPCERSQALLFCLTARKTHPRSFLLLTRTTTTHYEHSFSTRPTFVTCRHARDYQSCAPHLPWAFATRPPHPLLLDRGRGPVLHHLGMQRWKPYAARWCDW